MGLNHYAINRIIGGRPFLASSARFGAFGVMSTTGEILRHKPGSEARTITFSREDDQLLVEAFEEIRKDPNSGRLYAPDRLLWDAELAKRLQFRSRELGVHAPDSSLIQRLITIRKSPALFSKRGINLRKSTAVEPRPTIVHEYAHAIEFALIRFKHELGVSIDQILATQELALRFEMLAREIAGEDLLSADLRLGALYIRKKRYLKKEERTLFDHLSTDVFEREFVNVGSLPKVDMSAIPAKEGLIEIKEADRHLYVARGMLQAIAIPFVEGRVFSAIANKFWQPDPRIISASIFVGREFEKVDIARWHLKIIHDRKPAFNWPVSDKPLSDRAA